MTRVVAVIQARIGSSRLPGKALTDISGKPMFQHIVERMRACATLDDIVLATTEEPADAALLRAAEGLGVQGFAGSVEDVLDRTFRAARGAGADVVVRVTGDDPLKDPGVTDRAVRLLLTEEGDYATNTLVPTYPEGIDIEVMTLAALNRAWKEARLQSEREHVTPFIWKHPEIFRVANFTHTTDLSSLRWTVDYPEDLAFVRAVYDALYDGSPFSMQDVLDLLVRRPELGRINTGIARNAGYERSLAADRPID
jgi:spore coat polysaccharide biosynthesis protein SpsF